MNPSLHPRLWWCHLDPRIDGDHSPVPLGVYMDPSYYPWESPQDVAEVTTTQTQTPSWTQILPLNGFRTEAPSLKPHQPGSLSRCLRLDQNSSLCRPQLGVWGRVKLHLS